MQLLSTMGAATLLGMSPDNVRYHAKQGHLLAIRVERGPGECQRLFVQEDVERFRQARLAKKQAGCQKENATKDTEEDQTLTTLVS
jgi:DNA-binding transcriptional MerR regulator